MRYAPRAIRLPRLRGPGGARRSRTDDILLAKQALYQLSYGPFSGSSQESCRRTVQMDPRGLVGPGRLELPTLRLSGVRSNHLSYGPRAARQPGVPGSRSRHSITDPNDRCFSDESGKRNGDGGIPHVLLETLPHCCLSVSRYAELQ